PGARPSATRAPAQSANLRLRRRAGAWSGATVRAIAMAVANETRSARFHPSRAGARAGIGAAAWPVVVASVMAMAVVTLAGCEQKRPPRRVMLGLSWVHQAQFSGPYHADQHGLYAGAG